MRSLLAIVVELLGLGAVVYAGWLIAPWLAWLLGGLFLILIGQALDRSGA